MRNREIDLPVHSAKCERLPLKGASSESGRKVPRTMASNFVKANNRETFRESKTCSSFNLDNRASIVSFFSIPDLATAIQIRPSSSFKTGEIGSR
jgi:hypothetical protein